MGFLCLTLYVIVVLRWENGLTGIFPTPPENPEVETTQESSSFVTDWCRVRNARVDWRGLLKPCSKSMPWSSKVYDKSLRTNATTSSIISWDLNPAGRFSRFVIQSRTRANVAQKSGGDSWLVRIQGEAYISATVIDHDNGTYEVLFLPMEAGVYQAQIRLDYSLCDGYRDPPTDWFIRGKYEILCFAFPLPYPAQTALALVFESTYVFPGNSHGKHQPEGTLGTLDDYLLQPLRAKPLHEFHIESGKATSAGIISKEVKRSM